MSNPCEDKPSFFFFFVFDLGFSAGQDYFTHFESAGGAKTGDPQEKTPDYLQAELGLSHTHTHSGEMTSDLEH